MRFPSAKPIDRENEPRRTGGAHLVAFDRLLGLDWPAYYAYVTSHRMLGLAYALLCFAALPFIAFGIIALPMMQGGVVVAVVLAARLRRLLGAADGNHRPTNIAGAPAAAPLA